MARKSAEFLHRLDGALRMIEATDTGVIYQTIRDAGGSVDFKTGAYVVALSGVRGTSTVGRPQAVQAWIRAAKRKLEAVS